MKYRKKPVVIEAVQFINTPEKQQYSIVEGMDFGEAIEALKKGFKVARKGWNGKNQFLYLVKGSSLEYRTEADLSMLEGQDLPHSDVIAMKTTVGVVQVGWLASQTDMLAEDWMIVE